MCHTLTLLFLFCFMICVVNGVSYVTQREVNRGQPQQTIHTDSTTTQQWPFHLLDKEEFNLLAFYRMCNQSCMGQCGNHNRMEYSGCYCDEACQRLGDCCITYEQYCTDDGKPVTSHNWTEVVQQRKILPHSCISTSRETEDNDFKIIDGCFPGIKSDPTNIKRCIRVAENFQEFAQVVYLGVIYKNYFCVKCNHPESLSSDIQTNKMSVNCFKTSNQAYSIYQESGISAFFTFATEKCTIFQNWTLPKDYMGNRRFYCDDVYARRKCDNTSTGESEYNEHMCIRYTGEYGGYTAKERYSNPHCMRCSAHGQPPSSHSTYWNIFCIKGRTSDRGGKKYYNSYPNFSIFLDFKSAIKVGLEINSKEVCADHDIVTDSCITSSCPTGLIRLKSNDCVRYDARHSRQLLSARHGQSFRIVAVISNVTVPNLALKLTPILEGLTEYNMENRHMELMIAIGMDQYTPCQHQAIGNDEILRRTLLSYYGTLDGLVCCERDIPKDMYYNHLRNGFNYSRPLNDNLKNRRIHFIFLNHAKGEVTSDRKCEFGDVRKDFIVYDDDEIKLLGYDLTGRTYTNEFLINSTLLNYEVKNTPIILASEYFANGSSISNKMSMVCVPEIIRCKTITFRKNQFSYQSKDQVTLSDYRLDNCLQIDEDSVVSFSNGEIIVACVEKLETLAICRSTQSIVKETLSIIGVTISIACLAATIGTYTIHSTLRAGPGICVLSLSISIFLAQLIFLTNTSALGNTVACGFVGALQHYTWLSAFCWMNVMAVDIWKVFSTPTGSLSSKGKERKKFLLYSCYAWGVPLIFVFILYIVYLSKESSSHYGGIDSCFIVGKSIIYLFAIPLFIIICSNCIFFGLTIVSLRKSIKITSQVRPVESRSELMIYIKMASLMGFTWLFGFLANIPKMEWLFYPFIVCNSLQGVAIFISFGFNKRSRGLWRGLLRECVMQHNKRRTSSRRESSRRCKSEKKSLSPMNSVIELSKERSYTSGILNDNTHSTDISLDNM